jgi:hypothetical protein
MALLLAAAVAAAARVGALAGVGLPQLCDDPLDVVEREGVLALEALEQLRPQLCANLRDVLFAVAAVPALAGVAAEVAVLQAVTVLVRALAAVAADNALLILRCLRLRRIRREVEVK